MANLSQRRLVENEVIFRKFNQDAQKQIQEDYAADERQSIKLHFYCECSDIACLERIVMNVDEYQQAHRDPAQFTVLTGHQEPSVEVVVIEKGGYSIVHKFIDPSKVLNK